MRTAGKTLVLYREFSGYSGDAAGSIQFADGTTLNHDQIAAAAPIAAVPGNTVRAPSDVTVLIGPQDGAEIKGDGTNKGVTVVWSAESGNAVGQWWGDGNKAEGTDPSKVVLSGLNPSDVTLTRTPDDRWAGDPYDNLTITNKATGKTLTLYREFSGYSGDAAGSIQFADGTALNHDQIAAAAPARPARGSVLKDPSDMEIVLGPGDGTGVQGHGTSHGLKLEWSSTSGSASTWFWSDANRAEGSDPSSLDLTDLDPSDVTLSRAPDPNWGDAIDNLVVTDNATGKTLTITREFSGYSGDGVGSIHFADGTTLNHDQIAAQASPSLLAGPDNVTLNAPDGSATLTAGIGNDTLIGGVGNDTFVYKAIDGNATIADHADASQAARSNTLQLSDLNVADLRFAQQNNDLVIAIAGTGRAITISGEFNSADHDGVQNFNFADGSQLSRSDMVAKLHPPS